uniref:non-specific serine/threonine protein kinase n=1 Tax=Octopus bimaculoides TaxID=37653 RepID=A0A0L8ICJ6_OCTBM
MKFDQWKPTILQNAGKLGNCTRSQADLAWFLQLDALPNTKSFLVPKAPKGSGQCPSLNYIARQERPVTYKLEPLSSCSDVGSAKHSCPMNSQLRQLVFSMCVNKGLLIGEQQYQCMYAHVCGGRKTELEDSKREYGKNNEQLQNEKDDLINKMNKMADDLKNEKSENNISEIEQLRKLLQDERLKKIQAVNKLAEVMNRKEFADKSKKPTNSNSGALRKRDKECRRLQQELTMEREKYTKMVEKFQRDISEMVTQMNDEMQAKAKLQMELDAKDSEIEQLQQKLANPDNTSVNSGSVEEFGAEDGLTDNVMEGRLAIPHKPSTKKLIWKKQFVVASSRKILFYNTPNDKQNSDPVMVLDIDKLFHVRPVTQGDVYRADSKDIPRIFQILYATEGENIKPGETAQESQDRTGFSYKGHDLIPIHYRIPATCDSCNKPVWHVIHPPAALECKRCHVKVHREHYEKEEEFIGYCKVNYDIQAKELLLLAESSEKQKSWVQHLGRKIPKKGITPAGSSSSSVVPSRSLRQYSSYGPLHRHSSVGKSATLPPNTRP